MRTVENTRGLRIDISIGGPIWAMKGWPPAQSVQEYISQRRELFT